MTNKLDLAPIRKNVEKAKLRLMLGHKTTFFSALLSNLKIIIDESHNSASTNGIYLQISPSFVKDFDRETLLGLMLHEVMHVAFEHTKFELYEGLDDNILNIAQDHYINLYITSEGFVIPKGGYCDQRYRGKSSMEIYHILMKNPPDTSKFKRDVFGCPKNADKQEHSEAVTSNIIKAVLQAQMNDDAGSIPGSVLRKLEDVINPKLPWQVILTNYLDAYAKNEYSFRRPNRRFMPEFYLPTLQGESLKQITAGADVSLSMDQKDLNEIHCEIKYIWDVFQPEKMRYMTFDTRVHLNKTFNHGETLDEVKLMGGGGTNVQPLLDTIRKEEPVFALIFTDGYFAKPNMEGITTDVFWIINGNPKFNPPHGVVIPFQ